MVVVRQWYRINSPRNGVVRVINIHYLLAHPLPLGKQPQPLLLPCRRPAQCQSKIKGRVRGILEGAQVRLVWPAAQGGLALELFHGLVDEHDGRPRRVGVALLLVAEKAPTGGTGAHVGDGRGGALGNNYKGV